MLRICEEAANAPALPVFYLWRFQRRQDGHTMPVQNEHDNAMPHNSR